MRHPRHVIASLVIAGAVCASVPAWTQTIRIPDFRQSPAVSQVKPGEPCSECGRIVSIREVQVDRKAVVPASFQGANRGPVDHNFVGAVVYLPISNSSSDRPFVGGVGTPEMRERFGETTYHITMRMEDGTLRYSQRSDAAQYRVGDRVRTTEAGALELIAQ